MQRLMIVRRVLRSLTVVVVLAAVPFACGDGNGLSSDEGDDVDSIEGEYVATEVSENGRPKALVENTTVRLRLQDGQLTASAGCNTIGGAYTVEDGRLRVDALAMTEMGCDPPRHEQDEWLAAVLSASRARVEENEQGFVLRTDAVSITFVDESIVTPDRDLIGTTWLVDGIMHGTGPDGAVSSAPDDAGLLVFDANGYVTGDDGCNGFGYASEDDTAPIDGLRYEVNDDRITFTGSAVSTLRACDGVDTGPYWSVLSSTVTWEIDGTRLMLRNEQDDGVMYQARD